MRIARPNRSLASVTKKLFEPFLLFRSLNLSSSQQISFPIFHSLESDNFATLSIAEDEKYGFHRQGMYRSNLAGTVGAYDRHVFLCYKSPEAWAPRVEDSEADRLPKLLSSAVRARKNDISVKTKLTICEAREETEYSDGDVLIFPEMFKYRGLKDEDVDSFVEDVLVNGELRASGVHDVLAGSHVFVCAHHSRDRRCGVCGPVLISKLKEEIELRGLKDRVCVTPCSHIGGHKYAGNLIIYSPGPDGRIMGHWYGYVTPDDVPELLDKHIGKGEIIERLWRGQMGTHDEGGKNGDRDKLPNVEACKETEDKHRGNGSQGNKENIAGFYQGASGFTRCRGATLEKNIGDEEKKLQETAVPGGRGRANFLRWIRTWEQIDILAATAIVGTMATVAVAYSFQQRSSYVM